MNIFNSLGSNYSFASALRVLVAMPSKRQRRQLIGHLEGRYGGKALLTYKGREAIQLALEAIGAGGAVAVNGFTCFAVYEAVAKSGYRASYLDISDASLNFSPGTLAAALEKDPSIKVVVIQNTLGYPCDIRAIAELCKRHNVVLIEDLAHSIGTWYASGEEAGTVGDFVVLSFSQDKIVDGMTGGALVVRNPAYTVAQPHRSIGFSQQMKNRCYLLITVCIRTAYAFGLGERLHEALRSFYRSRPPTGIKKGTVRDLPDAYCANILKRLKESDKDISHRREIAGIYARELDSSLVRGKECAEIARSTCLRFPVMVGNRDSLVAFMRARGVDIHDTWYDAPVAPKKILPLTSYAGECPVAERTAEHIANLPTHRGVSPESARIIAKAVNEWHHTV